ncbi:MAG: DUF4340 domain-containing protein, partial [Anaerolineales bacterium]
DVQRFEIEGEENTLAFERNAAGEWILPDYDEYPADLFDVNNFLDRLSGIRSGRIIAQNESSHRTLGVSPDEFERQVTVDLADADDFTLFIGTSAGANATHMRRQGEDIVYLVGGLGAVDVRTNVTAWIDPLYFEVTQENVTSMTLENENGTFEFERDAEGAWTFTGLEDDETFNPARVQTLLSQITSVRMQEPLSRDEQDEYGIDDPAATITLTAEIPVEAETPDEPSPEATAAPEPEEIETETQEFTLVIGAELDEGRVLKAEDAEYYVLWSATNANNFVNATRDEFLSAPEAPEDATSPAIPPLQVPDLPPDDE